MKLDLNGIHALAQEQGIDAETVDAALSEALRLAYLKMPHAAKYARVELDPRAGSFTIWARDEIPQEPTEDNPHPAPELGEEYDDTPHDFGRLAASTARQVIQQLFRKAEDDRVFGAFSGQRGKLITGVVQQDVYLFSGSVYENIAYGKPGASRQEVEAAARLAGAHEFIAALKDGDATYVGERGVKLSGGQKQRIAIARVFLKNPPILILDEATSALDNESEVLVGKSLEQLAVGRTTLTIAHRLTTIQHADRILVLGATGIEEQGTHAELLAKQGTYYRLWNGLVNGE